MNKHMPAIPSVPPARPAPPALHIDTARIQHNWHRYRTLCGDGVTVSAVVKANAYGCGVTAVAECLWAVGCRTFWVATLQEAIALRTHLNNTATEIIVLEGIFDPALYTQHHLTAVINHPAQLVHTQSVPCWLHIDTGMNRLGIHHSTARAHIIQHIKTHTDKNIIGYMTHLQSAEMGDSPENPSQYHRFHAAIQNLPKKPLSMCNSDGVFLGKKYHADMVRIGIGLYGINTDAHGLTCAVACTAPIIHITHIAAGETVGYNGTYTAAAAATIATLGIGYNDGIGTPYSNCTTVYHNHIPCPVVGRVSMDSMCVDISHVPQPQLGDRITLFKDAQSVRHIHKKTALPPHMILCTIGERVEKVYTAHKEHPQHPHKHEA